MAAPSQLPPPDPLALHALTSHPPALHVPLPHLAADLERLARRVDDLADDVRRIEERLRRRAASVAWESAAAGAYQQRAAAHAAGLARCAVLVDEVAEDLRHHARVVHERAEAVRRGAEAARDRMVAVVRELT